MSIRITKQGIFDTLQDKGRYGYQHLGINPGGAMDAVAASVANMLVGNNMNEAVIELHFPASFFFFEKPALIALSGADFSGTVNNEKIPLDTAIIISSSSELVFKQYKRGARCYIAVQGGWHADSWLNSYSTNTKVQAGGFHGKPLKKNDIVHTRAEQFLFSSLPHRSHIVTSVKADLGSIYAASHIRCIKGMQYDWLNETSKNIFDASAFKMTVQSDRMGYRLQNEPMQTIAQKKLLSSAVTKGAIQLLPNGQLIILMADHQTTGGYPVIANVISADIHLLAQMQPGSDIHFHLITMEDAELLYVEQQQHLLQLQDDCNLELRNFLNQ